MFWVHGSFNLLPPDFPSWILGSSQKKKILNFFALCLCCISELPCRVNDPQSKKHPVELLFFFFNFKIYLFILNLFLAVLGLRCCVRAFSSCGERGLLFAAVHWLLIAVASLVVEHGL